MWANLQFDLINAKSIIYKYIFIVNNEGATATFAMPYGRKSDQSVTLCWRYSNVPHINPFSTGHFIMQVKCSFSRTIAPNEVN